MDALVWNNELYVFGDFNNLGLDSWHGAARYDGNWHSLGYYDKSSNYAALGAVFKNKLYVASQKSVGLVTTLQVLTGNGIEASEPASCNIYPNPVTDYFNLQLNSTLQPQKVEIYNMGGVEVLNEPFRSQYNVAHLPAGMYYLRLLDKKQNVLAQSKLVISR